MSSELNGVERAIIEHHQRKQEMLKIAGYTHKSKAINQCQSMSGVDRVLNNYRCIIPDNYAGRYMRQIGDDEFLPEPSQPAREIQPIILDDSQQKTTNDWLKEAAINAMIIQACREVILLILSYVR